MNVRRLPTLADKIALLKLGQQERLTAWERARLEEWSELAVGSIKQQDAVDRMGRKLYGVENWEIYARGIEVL